jgi:hypothetical protein
MTGSIVVDPNREVHGRSLTAVCAGCGKTWGRHYGSAGWCHMAGVGDSKFTEARVYERLHEDERDGFIRTYRTNSAPFNAEQAWKATKMAAGDAS